MAANVLMLFVLNNGAILYYNVIYLVIWQLYVLTSLTMYIDYLFCKQADFYYAKF